jgi:HD-GYP domain-containing protein (c-di-GMP phosphodiesterase class II)
MRLPVFVQASLSDPGQPSGDIIQEYLRLLTSLLSHLPGMAYRCRNTKERTMEFVSQGCIALTGYVPDDLLLDSAVAYGNLIHPQDRDEAWRTVEAALQAHRAFDIAYRLQSRHANTKWLRDLGCGVYTDRGDLLAIEGFVADITDFKQSEMRIRRQVDRLDALRKIGAVISTSFNLQMILEILLNQITSQLGVDAADILLLQPSMQRLEFAAGAGFHTTALKYTSLRVGDGLAGRAALERQVVAVENLSLVLESFSCASQIKTEEFASYCGVPLIAKGQVRGVLELFHRTHIERDPDWLDFLQAVASQAAIAIDNAMLFNDLQRSNDELTIMYDATLEGWSRALELRDREAKGHAQRVTDMTIQLAKILGIEGVDLQHIRRGAMLHDIGKMGIPDSILLKPGPLVDEEWTIMRQHPVYAFDLLSPIAYLRPALDIPYCHHEKWDGTGYPRQLAGDQIPLAARIFTLADVYDALTSIRPYRPAWPNVETRDYIRAQSGQLFDPGLVKLFLRYY